ISRARLSVLPYTSTPTHYPSFFLSLQPPPLKSTLFPYTTLFRSWVNQAIYVPISFVAIYAVWAIVDAVGNAFAMFMNGVNEIRIDRKSTRLNSSHVSISYAVFCLKKKKKKKKNIKTISINNYSIS